MEKLNVQYNQLKRDINLMEKDFLERMEQAEVKSILVISY